MKRSLLLIALVWWLGGCIAARPQMASQGLYIALGDSLTAGIGAKDQATQSFPRLLADALGPGITLMNLGRPGATSADLLTGGQVDIALAQVRAARADGNPANDLVLITITVGGNDLMEFYKDYFLTGLCPDLETSKSRPQCFQALQEIIDTFAANLGIILSRLREGEPEVPILVFTLYHPFQGDNSALAQLGDLVLEGGEALPLGVNDRIRAVAAAHRAQVVDLFPTFSGRRELLYKDGIHPNEEGYALMARLALQVLFSGDEYSSELEGAGSPGGHEEVRGSSDRGGASGDKLSPQALPAGGASPPLGEVSLTPR